MMIDLDLTTERAIIDSILAAVPEPEPPREPKGAAYWTAFFADQPHEPPPLPLRPVTVWRYAAGSYDGAAVSIRRRPWYLRECIRCRPVIVPLQRLACWLML